MLQTDFSYGSPVSALAAELGGRWHLDSQRRVTRLINDKTAIIANHPTIPEKIAKAIVFTLSACTRGGLDQRVIHLRMNSSRRDIAQPEAGIREFKGRFVFVVTLPPQYTLQRPSGVLHFWIAHELSHLLNGDLNDEQFTYKKLDWAATAAGDTHRDTLTPELHVREFGADLRAASLFSSPVIGLNNGIASMEHEIAYERQVSRVASFLQGKPVSITTMKRRGESHPSPKARRRVMQRALAQLSV